jgi:hypothetical protein
MLVTRLLHFDNCFIKTQLRVRSGWFYSYRVEEKARPLSTGFEPAVRLMC